MTEPTMAYVVIDDVMLQYNLREYEHDTAALLGKIKVDVFNLKYGVSFAVFADGPRRGQAYFLNRWRRGVRTMKITPSENFTRAMGQTVEPRAATKLKPGKVLIFQGIPNVHLGLPHPITMLQCDLIKPNIMCGQQAQLLQVVPVLERRENDDSRVYEPQQLTYHPVPHRPFNTLRFEFTDPDGSSREFETESFGEGTLVTLIFRKRPRINKPDY
jgi:hypothetical protein